MLVTAGSEIVISSHLQVDSGADSIDNDTHRTAVFAGHTANTLIVSLTQGFSLDTVSGHDFSAPPSQIPVPGPPPLLLVAAAGLIALVGHVKRRRDGGAAWSASSSASGP